jgi:maltooligosyltrehalose trehalohydrolase
VIERGRGAVVVPLDRVEGSARFTGFAAGVGPPDRYRCRLDRGPLHPDPASRYQPEGVHGASQVVDAGSFRWSDGAWRGLQPDRLVLYELHVGAFTPEGSFAAAAERLPALADLGVTAVELMPVGDFPGRWNWGYDVAALFAPARCYGSPDDLRAFVDRAHALGLAVFVDVVYNHLGPDGAYVAVFQPEILSKRHESPWGRAINLDGERSREVREFLVENALYWVHEFHVDGLRLDSTHDLVDDGPRHFLDELAERVRASAAPRTVLVIAEDNRNAAHLVRSQGEAGFDLDGVWADDFHHEMRRLLAGDRHGYFEDFAGSVVELATVLRRGWLYCGQRSAHFGGPRGEDPKGIAPRRFVFCIQNHDQIGNRARGERLNHEIGLPAYRAASAVLLCAAQTPLLFMGQEWAAGTPFLYFTDHHPDLGRRVSEGRRREFARFPAFSDPSLAARLPDPQSPASFRSSVLDWSEREREPHAGVVRLYRALLEIRREEPAMRCRSAGSFDAVAATSDALALRRTASFEPTVLLVAQLRGSGSVTIDERLLPGVSAGARLEPILSTEDGAYAADPRPVALERTAAPAVVRFDRPGALLLRVRRDPDRESAR